MHTINFFFFFLDRIVSLHKISTGEALSACKIVLKGIRDWEGGRTERRVKICK